MAANLPDFRSEENEAKTRKNETAEKIGELRGFSGNLNDVLLYLMNRQDELENSQRESKEDSDRIKRDLSEERSEQKQRFNELRNAIENQADKARDESERVNEELRKNKEEAEKALNEVQENVSSAQMERNKETEESLEQLKMSLDEEKMLRRQDNEILKFNLKENLKEMKDAASENKAEMDKILDEDREERNEQSAQIVAKLDKERRERQNQLAKLEEKNDQELESAAMRLNEKLDEAQRSNKDSVEYLEKGLRESLNAGLTEMKDVVNARKAEIERLLDDDRDERNEQAAEMASKLDRERWERETAEANNDARLETVRLQLHDKVEAARESAADDVAGLETRLEDIFKTLCENVKGEIDDNKKEVLSLMNDEAESRQNCVSELRESMQNLDSELKDGRSEMLKQFEDMKDDSLTKIESGLKEQAERTTDLTRKFANEQDEVRSQICDMRNALEGQKCQVLDKMEERAVRVENYLDGCNESIQKRLAERDESLEVNLQLIRDGTENALKQTESRCLGQVGKIERDLRALSENGLGKIEAEFEGKLNELKEQTNSKLEEMVDSETLTEKLERLNEKTSEEMDSLQREIDCNKKTLQQRTEQLELGFTKKFDGLEDELKSSNDSANARYENLSGKLYDISNFASTSIDDMKGELRVLSEDGSNKVEKSEFESKLNELKENANSRWEEMTESSSLNNKRVADRLEALKDSVQLENEGNRMVIERRIGECEESLRGEMTKNLDCLDDKIKASSVRCDNLSGKLDEVSSFASNSITEKVKEIDAKIESCNEELELLETRRRSDLSTMERRIDDVSTEKTQALNDLIDASEKNLAEIENSLSKAELKSKDFDAKLSDLSSKSDKITSIECEMKEFKGEMTRMYEKFDEGLSDLESKANEELAKLDIESKLNDLSDKTEKFLTDKISIIEVDIRNCRGDIDQIDSNLGKMEGKTKDEMNKMERKMTEKMEVNADKIESKMDDVLKDISHDLSDKTKKFLTDKISPIEVDIRNCRGDIDQIDSNLAKMEGKTKDEVNKMERKMTEKMEVNADKIESKMDDILKDISHELQSGMEECKSEVNEATNRTQETEKKILEDTEKKTEAISAKAADLEAKLTELAENSSKGDEIAALKSALIRLEASTSLPLSVYFSCVRDDSYVGGGEENLTFSRCLVNAGGAMDPDKGEFVAPRSGAYLFTLNVCSHDRKKVLLAIKRNGKEIASLYDQNHVDNHKNSMSGQAVITELMQGDVVHVYLYTSSGIFDKSGNHLTQFSGILLRPVESLSLAEGVNEVVTKVVASPLRRRRIIMSNEPELRKKLSTIA